MKSCFVSILVIVCMALSVIADSPDGRSSTTKPSRAASQPFEVVLYIDSPIVERPNGLEHETETEPVRIAIEVKNNSGNPLVLAGLLKIDPRLGLPSNEKPAFAIYSERPWLHLVLWQQPNPVIPLYSGHRQPVMISKRIEAGECSLFAVPLNRELFLPGDFQMCVMLRQGERVIAISNGIKSQTVIAAKE